MPMPKMLEIRGRGVKTDRADKNQNESHEIEPNPSKDKTMHEGDNPSFYKCYYKIYIFLKSSIHIRILK
jgi:hypothetical protein